MLVNDALEDLDLEGRIESKSKFNVFKWLKKHLSLDLFFTFFSRAFFSYLPLTVYSVINTPFFEQFNEGDKDLFQGLFLALSYVFISQLNSTNKRQESSYEFMHALRVFCGVICIVFSTTNEFEYRPWMFLFFLIVSMITLFYTARRQVIEKNILKSQSLSHEKRVKKVDFPEQYTYKSKLLDEYFKLIMKKNTDTPNNKDEQ